MDYKLFTVYILVQACTSGGCGQSISSSLKTLQAMPTSQAAPNVTALNAVTALFNPNGLLIHSPAGGPQTTIFNMQAPQMTLQTVVTAPDGFDAVSVQNVGSTYIIVSWDLPTDSNGILINFSLYCNGALAGVLPLTLISYNTTSLLPITLYMYRPYGGAYSHSPIPQLEQDVVAPGHKEHEEPLAVSIPSHHWMENYSSLGSKFRFMLALGA
eukprot:Em0005g296a